MAYASASDIASLTKNLLGSASEYDTSTSPTLAQVNAWLSTGCSVINAVLKSRGYGAIGSTSDAYGLAQQANALYAAWLAESSRSNARVAANERTRGQMFKRDFDSMLEWLTTLDLSVMGVTQASRAYAGGLTVSDKAKVEADADRVRPRFGRDMFAHPDAQRPTTTSAS